MPNIIWSSGWSAIAVYTLLAVALGLVVIQRAKAYYTAAASAARQRNDKLVRQLNRALHAKEARESSEEEILAVRSELVRARARGRQLADECSRLRRASIDLEATVVEAQLSSGTASSSERSAPPRIVDAAHAAARIMLPVVGAPRGDEAQRAKRRVFVDATGGEAAALRPADPTDAGTQRSAEVGAKGELRAGSAAVLVLPPHGTAAAGQRAAGQPAPAVRATSDSVAAPRARVVPRAAIVAEPATLRSALRPARRGGGIPPPPLDSPPPLPPPGSPRGAVLRASAPLLLPRTTTPRAAGAVPGAVPTTALATAEADGGGGGRTAHRAAPRAPVAEKVTASSQRKRRPLVWEESGTTIASKETESLRVGVPKVWGHSQLYALEWSFEADGDLTFGVRIFDGDSDNSALRVKATRGVEATYAVQPVSLRSQAQQTLLPGNRQALLEWTNDPGWAQLWSPSRRSVRLRYTVTLKPVAT